MLLPSLLKKRVHSVFLPVAALLGAASVLLFQRLDVSSAPEVDLQTKGSIELLVYARTNERITLLDRFNRGVAPGTEVRFILTGVPDEHTHVMIASVDARANTSVYFPFEGKASAPLPGPGRWEVPDSIVLDDSIGPERVFALFSKRPLDAQKVKAELARRGKTPNAIRDLSELDLPDTTQRSFLMFKRPERAL